MILGLIGAITWSGLAETVFNAAVATVAKKAVKEFLDDLDD